ncbi:uncharacterized protein At4g18257-like [Dioscorea cayenensis subsp. rotundata]|uniref:Uncharacterized protein At4g18257-like n=1 Tax=Dioscorea cayennensis subsp. rotundata TaxID=55577 RepID=A0AB40AKZ9_DIOCR|nr:uncharacterized protein At4g18257-like [Dioscorea cayenensis subsp. rotundata]
MVGEGKRVESLGWLTESSVMPKKHKAIEGVGASSIVELKAQLYRTQEETRKSKDSDAEFLRAKKKPLSNDLFSHKNTGVDARAHRDKMELKAVNDGSVSYAALERKAELYDKLARGELPDEEDKEKYCVDFFQKSLVEDQPQLSESDNTSNSMPQENKDSDADDMLPNSRPVVSDQANFKLDHEEHKRFVREVHEEATQEREKATSIKLRRQEQLAARREKLRQAYLRKQLEKLTSEK